MPSHLESRNTASLDVAQQAFDHWRHTRARRSSTPRMLRRQAVSLIGEHRRSHICTALRINDQALKQWACEFSNADNAQRIEHQSEESAKIQGAFAELPVPYTCAVVMHSKPVTAIRIDLPNGTVIRTDKMFSLEQVVSAVCVSSEPGA